jgi:hypothetical protein
VSNLFRYKPVEKFVEILKMASRLLGPLRQSSFLDEEWDRLSARNSIANILKYN